MKRQFLIMLFLFFFASVVYADDIKYKDFSLEPGYKFYFSDGDISKVSEYYSAKPSAFVSVIYKDLSPNNKVMFDASISEKDDRTLDFHFIHKDMMTIELSDYYFVHNLGRKTILYNPNTFDLNPESKYSLDVIRNYLKIKYKPFELPFHLGLFIENFERDGTVQKRFYGARSFDPNILSLPPVTRNNIFSRDRQIGFELERISGILDGVFGGVGFVSEISTENFTNKHKNSLDNLLNYPSINSSSYNLKFYSNLTGQITWALSFNRRDSKNHNRDEIGREGAEITQTDSTALLSYYPDKKLKLSLKLSYTDRDQDNPDTVKFNGIDIVGIKDAVSFVKKTAELNAWYGFMPELNFKIKLQRKELERSYNNFELPEYSHTNIGVFSIEGRFKKGFSYKISQKLENNHNPSYKKTPEMSYQTTVNLNYDFNSNSGIYMNSDYIFSRNDVEAQFFKKSWEYRHFINYWLNLDDNLNINVYGAYNNEKYISDVHFGTTSPTFIIDRNVPFQFTNYYAGLNFNKNITSRYSIYSDINYMRGYGTYYPHLVRDTVTTLGPPPVTYTFDTVGLDSLSSTDFYQYRILIGNKFGVIKNGNVRVELGYIDHVDKTNYPSEGTIKTIFVAWEQKW